MALRDHSLDDKITNAAMDEFLDKGYMRASLRQIAAKAGVTVGAIANPLFIQGRVIHKFADLLFRGYRSRVSGNPHRLLFRYGPESFELPPLLYAA